MTVTGVDDNIIDGTITSTITIAVDDANSDNDFDSVDDETVSVTTTDDDVAGFTITETGGLSRCSNRTTSGKCGDVNSVK